ncbi:MAG: 50S ribosomal protein L13 [Candidatus Harrisonbacteria bacterium CG10_big_fil_rev_8_21_14_0_10_38_8]|uniref:Large ribosomal subunit protein uL13 n=1 Tax=Candidatus Harrisonbacteria bacterium CG10_big_fil_rev_8_21_14_0_10_38_8 TaxID=1974582 RepID=A0A2M6WJL9_9BACT|nr:MAG: 50S ribosomal protein L13 [Candidatus Harrisonbacteria bacterium CG10_big_fil_rev_8_21_14_0_10_38_8]
MATKAIGKGKKVEIKEYVIDAQGKILGRLASEVAVILQGKNTPDYERNKVGNTKVVIKNAKGIQVTGNKENKKVYYHHTGYMGHLREETYRQVFKKDPTEVIRKAVFNMLPKNLLRQRRMNRLTIEE